MSHMPPTSTPGGSAVPDTRRVDTGTGLTGGGDLTVDRTIALADTAVTPGAYTSANLTVDQQGRITAAANGSSGAGTVTGTGTANALAKFTGASAVGNSSITDDGTKVLTALSTGIGDVASPSSRLDVAINLDTTTAQPIQTWRNNFAGQNFSVSLGVDSAKVVHLNASSGNTAWRFNNSAGTQVVRLDMKAGNQALLVNGDASVNGKTICNADGGQGAASDIAGTNLRVDGDVATNNYLTFRTSDAVNSGLVFNNVSGGAADGYIIYENAASAGSRRMDFAVAGVQQINLTTATTAIHNSLTVDGNVTLGDAGTDVVTINGYTGMGTSPTSNAQLNVASARQYGVYVQTTGAPAATNSTAINGSNVDTGKTGTPQVIYGGLQGSFDATAAARQGYAGYFEATSTRSAGANAVTNIGIFAHAANAQNNFALYTYSGDVWLNANSGNTTAFNNFTVNGNATLGDAGTDAHALNGTLNANATAGANGQVLTVVSGLPKWASAGTYLARQVISATGTYTPTAGTKRAFVRMVGGGGGGGGAQGANSQFAAGAGGASGSLIEKMLSNAGGLAGGAVTIGAAGAAGLAAAGNGGNGGDTTIVIDGVTWTAKGGTGGSGMTNGTAIGNSGGGGSQAGTSAGDVVVDAASGAPGVRFSSGAGFGGNGGGSPLGAGGRGATGSAVGEDGRGKGGGGGGGLAFDATSRAGGAGSVGVVIIDEWSA